jgi:hypothetical protein
MANSNHIYGYLYIRDDAIPRDITGFEKYNVKGRMRFYACVNKPANLNKYLLGTTTKFTVYKNKSKTESVEIELNDTRPDDFGVYMEFVKNTSPVGGNSRKNRKSRKVRKSRKQRRA